MIIGILSEFDNFRQIRVWILFVDVPQTQVRIRITDLLKFGFRYYNIQICFILCPSMACLKKSFLFYRSDANLRYMLSL